MDTRTQAPTKRRHREKGSGSVFWNEARQRWCAEVIVGRHPQTGKPKKRRISDRNKTNAVRKLRKLQASLDDGTYKESTHETVAEFMTRWLNDYAKISIRPSTYTLYESLVKHHINRHIGKNKLRDLKTSHIQALLARLLKEGRVDKKGGLSAKTVREVYTVLKAALTQAVDEGSLGTNPMGATKRPKKNKPQIRPFDPEEQIRFEQVAKKHELYVAWHLLLYTGLRRGEILGLTWAAVDLHKGQIYVRQQLVPRKDSGGRYDLCLVDVKTDAGRRNIPLPATTIKLLKSHRANQAQARLLFGPDYKNHDLVFCRPEGSPFDPRSFARRFERLVKKAGLSHRSVHDLRHTHATRLLEAGENPEVVRERLGHTSITMTLQTYSHVMPHTQQLVAERIEAQIQAMTDRMSDSSEIQHASDDM